MDALTQFLSGEVELPHETKREHQKVMQKKAAIRRLLEKRAAAASGGFLQALGKALPPALATAGAVAATGAIGSVVARQFSDFNRAVEKAKSFKRLIATYPDLKEYGAERLKNQFDTLHRFSPTVAQDPILASGWIRRINQFTIEGKDFVTPDVVRDLVSIESGVSGRQSSEVPQLAARSVGEFLKERFKPKKGGKGKGKK